MWAGPTPIPIRFQEEEADDDDGDEVEEDQGPGPGSKRKLEEEDEHQEDEGSGSDSDDDDDDEEVDEDVDDMNDLEEDQQDGQDEKVDLDQQQQRRPEGQPWSYPGLRYDCSCPGPICQFEEEFCNEEVIISGLRRNRRCCFVFGCGSKYPKQNRSGQRDAVLFKIPPNGNKELWKEKIPCKSDSHDFDFLTHYICHRHFKQHFLIKHIVEVTEDRKEIRTQLPVNEWKLTPDAVPTKFDLTLLEKKKRKKKVKSAGKQRRQQRKDAKTRGLPDPFAGTKWAGKGAFNPKRMRQQQRKRSRTLGLPDPFARRQFFCNPEMERRQARKRAKELGLPDPFIGTMYEGQGVFNPKWNGPLHQTPPPNPLPPPNPPKRPQRYFNYDYEGMNS